MRSAASGTLRLPAFAGGRREADMKLSRYSFAHRMDDGWWGLYTPFDHAVCFVSDFVWRKISGSISPR